MHEDMKSKQQTDWWKIIGLGLLITGASIFLENQLQTGWLFYLPPGAAAIYALVLGIRTKNISLQLVGLGLLSGVLILFLTLSKIKLSDAEKMGASLIIIGVAWLLYLLLAFRLRKNIEYWIGLVAGGFLGLGISFLWRDGQFVDFILWLSIGLGIPMLIWGFAKRYFGLLISGFILLSSGLGISIAWADQNSDINSLTRTGVMLITFALGWGGISVFSKRCLESVAWWPLIPAGVLSMSGWGLFIGGGANASADYIGNTLSLALIVLGVYVLLLRSGFNKK